MKDVPELFAELTGVMEDAHGIAVEGQCASLTPDVQALLLAGVKEHVRRLHRIMLNIAAALP